jgi:hypothetical protein
MFVDFIQYRCRSRPQKARFSAKDHADNRPIRATAEDFRDLTVHCVCTCVCVQYGGRAAISNNMMTCRIRFGRDTDTTPTPRYAPKGTEGLVLDLLFACVLIICCCSCSCSWMLLLLLLLLLLKEDHERRFKRDRALFPRDGEEVRPSGGACVDDDAVRGLLLLQSPFFSHESFVSKERCARQSVILNGKVSKRMTHTRTRTNNRSLYQSKKTICDRNTEKHFLYQCNAIWSATRCTSLVPRFAAVLVLVQTNEKRKKMRGSIDDDAGVEAVSIFSRMGPKPELLSSKTRLA